MAAAEDHAQARPLEMTADVEASATTARKEQEAEAPAPAEESALDVLVVTGASAAFFPVVAAEHEESAKIGAEIDIVQHQISVLSPQGAGANPFAAEPSPFATTWVDHSAEAADRLATSGRHSAPTTDAEGGKHQAPALKTL